MRLTILFAMIAMSGCAAKSSAPVAVAPVETRMQVCVVDPVAPGGMMTVSGIHVQGTRDTTVLQAEGRVPLSQITAGSKVWRSGPLSLTTTAGRTRFNPTGQPKVFEPGKITLLGLVGSVPVFANPADAAPMRAEIEALAAGGQDLEQSLRKNAALRRQMSRVRTLYVPTSLVNCVFQQFRR
jgi:hypothetical protein